MQYAFDQETMDLMMSGKWFKLKDDFRFKELPELTKFRAKKMTNKLGEELEKKFKNEFDKVQVEIERQEQKIRRMAQSGIGK